MKLQIKIEDERLLHDEYRMKYATPGSAAIDLRACGIVDSGEVKPIHHGLTLYPGEEVLLSAGFKMALPDNLAACIVPRSGLGARDGIVVGNLFGVIDSDYRNDVRIAIWYRKQKGDGRPFIINAMDRIVQMLIVPIMKPELEYVQELSETVRGEGGFNSTGVE